MKLQQQDYVSAQAIQSQILKIAPKDNLIQEFNQYLPDEAKAQKEAQEEYEYYDEEDDEKDNEDYDKEEEG